MKKSCCVFEKLYKIRKNGIFFVGICFFFVLEILTFLYYTNLESDDVRRLTTKMEDSE